MKLRNKKTGEIINNNGISFAEGNYKTYSSLAELNEDWEDYEDCKEQKEYWSINEFGSLVQVTHTRENIYDKSRKNFGNYFETKEEAERAVEKLKTWKRLKDKKAKIVGWCYSDAVDLDGGGCNFDGDDIIVGIDSGECDVNDLDLLFGGEE